MKTIYFWALIYAGLGALSCDPIARQVVDPTEQSTQALVELVTAQGSSGAYSFSVRISSPDTGCDQYADWWEVVSDSGTLLYRRILAHSHVDEQPFTRSGSPVPVSADQSIWVRVHMNNTGYSDFGAKGSINEGFERALLDPNFAPNLDEEEPLPSNCAF